MQKDDEVLNEHISLAIAMWSLGLPEGISITQDQRQDLHTSILRALVHVGIVEK